MAGYPCRAKSQPFQLCKECRLDKTIVSSIQHQDLLKAEQLTFTLSWLPNHSNQKNLCIAQRFFFMKLGPEAGQPAAHLPSNSDKSPRFYLLQNTRLVALAFFSLANLKRKDLNLVPIGDTMHTVPG